MARTYDMATRDRTAAATRTGILEAAHGLLNRGDGGALSVLDVAKAAGVSRATVYNSIGSRRALLIAVFEDQGRIIRFDRVMAAMALDDARLALVSTVRESARGWGIVPVAIRKTLALAVVDPEVGELVTMFESHRRAMLTTLARRARKAGVLGPGVSVAQAAASLALLTGFSAYDQLRLDHDPAATARHLVRMMTASLGLNAERE